MRKKGILVLILVAMGVVTYNYIYQDHRDISEEKPDVIVSSEEFIKQFSVNPQISEQQYNDQTIQITGTISEINNSDLTLDDAVFCQFKSVVNESLSLGDTLAIKGRCIGYDDLLEQVKLNECLIVKK
jgi:hypothetical protein